MHGAYNVKYGRNLTLVDFAVQSWIMPWITTFYAGELKDVTSSVGGILDTQPVIFVKTRCFSDSFPKDRNYSTYAISTGTLRTHLRKR